MSRPHPMLRLEGVSRSFGGLRAVDGCSFTVEAGSITGVVGPNGAGKTTVFNIIAGALAPTAGRVYLDGEDVTGLPPHALYARGLRRTFQIAHEFHRMTVFENLLVSAAGQPGESILGAMLRPGRVRAREEAIRARAEEVIEFLGLRPVAQELAGNLSGGQKKLLELGRTLMSEGKVVLLDEIAAGVNRTLLKDISARIRTLNRERGYTFCLVEHDMDFIDALCDVVIVMAEGRILTQGTLEELRRDPRVVEAYFGGGRAVATDEAAP